MATTLELLQQQLAAAQATYKAESDKYTSMTQDGNYAYQKSRLDDPRVKSNPRAWISADGTFWIGDDAKLGHDSGQAYVTQHELKMKQQHDIVDAAKLAVDAAGLALTNYEKNSPVAAAQLQLQNTNATTEAAKSKTRNTIIVIVVIVGVGLVAFFVWRSYKKGKKEKPAAAQAA